MDQLISVLSDTEYTEEAKVELAPKARNFFETLTRVRKKDYFAKFPHINQSIA